MLRAFGIKNFVGYRDLQYLEFEEGPNFIVGANSSGKTTIFETVRRCLSVKNNPTVSRIPESQEPAFAICKFKLEKALSTTILESQELTDECCLYSFYLITGENPKQLFKLICISDTDSNTYTYCDRLRVNKNKIDQTTTTSYNLRKETQQILYRYFEDINAKENAEECMETLIDKLNTTLHHEEYEQYGERNISPCEKILRKLEQVVVVTLPVRAFGPIQWNKSPFMNNVEEGWKTYVNPSDSAEILKELLVNEDVDRNKADAWFKLIASPHNYTFKLVNEEKNEIFTKEERDKSEKIHIVIDQGDDCSDIPLMKIPEGLLEARHFTLLLAHRKYQTICLEEPGRGMHPPMVQRMRDLLLRAEKKRTILVVSHKPAMTNIWAFERMFICRAIHDEDRVKHSVLKVQRGMVNMSQEENFKKMVYSSSVLFLEGDTDAIIIGAVFQEILDGYCIDNFPAVPSILCQTVSGTQIVKIGSSTSYNPYRQIAKNIEIPYTFLFDKDAVFQIETKDTVDRSAEGEPPKKRKDKTDKITALTEVIKLLREEKENVSQEITSMLEKKVFPPDTLVAKGSATKIFGIEQGKENMMESYNDINIYIWRSGELEDVLLKAIIQMESEEEKLKCLRLIFKCENVRKGNNPVKENLLGISREDAQLLARVLLKSKEVKDFLVYLCPK